MSPWSAAAWTLAALGHPLGGLALSAGVSAVLARRAGPDRATARALAELAWTGNLRAGRGLGEAVRRAWLPPALATAIILRQFGSPAARPFALALAVALVVEPAAEWVRERPAPAESGDAPGRSHRPGAGIGTWVALRLADDLAYQAGVWTGVLRARSIKALLPRW
jgi:hypothetical protein